MDYGRYSQSVGGVQNVIRACVCVWVRNLKDINRYDEGRHSKLKELDTKIGFEVFFYN